MTLNLSMDTSAFRKLDSSMVLSAKCLINDKLTEAGMDGHWVCKAKQQTKPKPCGKLYLRRVFVDSTGFSCIDMLVRPGCGSTSWNWWLYPAKGYDINDSYQRLLKVSEGKPLGLPSEATEDSEEKISVEDTPLAEGCIYDAKVVKALEYGVSIEVPKIGVRGIVPVKEWFGKHAPAQLRTVKPGTEITVMLFERSDPPKFSKVAAEQHIAINRGRYTGLPDKAGVLDLSGFSGSRTRMHKMLRWLADLQMAHLGKPVDKKVAADRIIEMLKAETGATKIFANAVHGVIRAMSTASFNWWVEIGENTYSLTSVGVQEANSEASPPPPPAPELEPAEKAEVFVEEPPKKPTVAAKQPPKPELTLDVVMGRMRDDLLKGVVEALHILLDEMDKLKAADKGDMKHHVQIITTAIVNRYCPSMGDKAMKAEQGVLDESKQVVKALDEIRRQYAKLGGIMDELHKATTLAQDHFKATNRKAVDLRQAVADVLPNCATTILARLLVNPETVTAEEIHRLRMMARPHISSDVLETMSVERLMAVGEKLSLGE